MTKDEALKMALETLEIWKGYMPHLWDKTDEQAITAIKEALAQPEQEPVACVEYIPCCTDKTCSKCKATTPPQRKPLTDEEIILIVAECASSHQHTDIHFARAIEAAVWEKQK